MPAMFDKFLGKVRDDKVSADAIADTLEAAAPADLARIRSSVSGDRWGVMQTVQVAEPVAGVAYTLKAPPASPLGAGIAWGVIRTTVSGDTAVTTYAGPANNPGQATGVAAWGNRAALIYGQPGEA